MYLSGAQMFRELGPRFLEANMTKKFIRGNKPMTCKTTFRFNVTNVKKVKTIYNVELYETSNVYLLAS